MLRPYCRPQTLLFLAVWLILMVAGRSRFFIDPGALWHIVVGRDILNQAQLPHVDSFSCTFAGQPWIAQQWLGEVRLPSRAPGFGGLDTILLATATAPGGHGTRGWATGCCGLECTRSSPPSWWR